MWRLLNLLFAFLHHWIVFAPSVRLKISCWSLLGAETLLIWLEHRSSRGSVEILLRRAQRLLVCRYSLVIWILILYFQKRRSGKWDLSIYVYVVRESLELLLWVFSFDLLLLVSLLLYLLTSDLLVQVMQSFVMIFYLNSGLELGASSRGLRVISFSLLLQSLPVGRPIHKRRTRLENLEVLDWTRPLWAIIKWLLFIMPPLSSRSLLFRLRLKIDIGAFDSGIHSIRAVGSNRFSWRGWVSQS